MINTNIARCNPGARTLFFLLILFGAVRVQAQPLPASLENPSENVSIELHVGTVSEPGADINGILLRFTGNFRAYPPDSMQVILNGWFDSPAGSHTYTWTFAADSAYADFEIWDTEEDLYSGYGKFLTFYRNCCIGNLVLDEIRLAAPPQQLEVQSARPLGPMNNQYVLYPNPAQTGQVVALDGLRASSQCRIHDAAGRLVTSVNLSPDSPELPELRPGVYFVTLNPVNGGRPEHHKLIMR